MLVIWLERSQLPALARVPPPAAGQIMFSGWQSGFENAPLPAEWKRIASMVYPVDAPQRRAARFEFNLRPWLRKHAIEHPDEILLGNTLAACNLLSESMSRLKGASIRDYLVEMIQNYPTGMGNAPASQAFPRFGLGPGQRYSSKGAYIVRFKDPAHERAGTRARLARAAVIPARAFSGCPRRVRVLRNAASSRGLHANQRCFVDIEPVHHVMDARFPVFRCGGSSTTACHPRDLRWNLCDCPCSWSGHRSLGPFRQ